MTIFTGTSSADTITGTSGDDLIYGLDDNDTLSGGAGADTIEGGSGNDYIDGGTGIDTLIGGLGNDTYIVDHVLDTIVENSGEGTDYVFASVNYVLSGNIEQLTLTGFATTGVGNSLNNFIYGSSINNTLQGNDGADRLYGYDGDDTLIGDAGNDQLFGGTGADLMYGGADNDVFDSGDGDDVMWGGTGNDFFYIDNINDIVVEYTGEGQDTVRNFISYTIGNNIEFMVMQGSSNIDGTGNSVANQLTGNSGNNILYGLGGVDTIRGGDGNDTLIGGTSGDHLYGQNGSDDFVFLQESVTTPVTTDYIYDFTVGDGDRIDVSAIDADTTTSGDQSFTLNTTGLTGVAGEAYMFYSSVDAATIVRFDVNGDGSSDFVIEVKSASLITTHVSTGPGDGGWIL